MPTTESTVTIGTTSDGGTATPAQLAAGRHGLQDKTATGTIAGTPRLGLRPKEAAVALGIGERLLWQKTNCNEIPHVRIGRAVVYPIDSLRAYLAGKAKGGRR